MILCMQMHLSWCYEHKLVSLKAQVSFFKKSLPVAFMGKKISVGFPHWLYNLPLDQSSMWSIKQTGSALFSQKWLSFYCQLL